MENPIEKMAKVATRIDVRGAVSAAKNYLISMRDLLGGTQDIRLEEVELSKDEQFWLITLGYNRRKDLALPDEIDYSDLSPEFIGIERDYKIFTVNAQTGAVESMKIREL
ncbi:MAG: hypothetical protein O4808_02585 [Trichodesmium sp. St17_bin3_1_1]|jgi:hypothetical protein|nr:hypothetical protein [Trichodesmium sp. St18_bin1]MDE5105993.1 hypothetical protein [Trichodesmium sp. St17_bin3_1_1]